MKIIKRITLALGILALFALGGGLSYVLPRHSLVVITGTEVKRIDRAAPAGSQSALHSATRDVYFINTETPDDHRPRVFANEDTRFGFPWYFKFDAADLQAQAQALSRDGRQLAVVTSYGWRINMFNLFPNAVAISPTHDGRVPFPWFNWLFFSISTLIALYLAWCWHRWRRSRQANGSRP